MKFEIEVVYKQISQHLRKTPLVRGKSLEPELECGLYFKMENEQITGSFKLRGALSKFSELKEKYSSLNKVVAASTGNHALAVCHAAKAYDAVPIIFVPTSVSKSKLSKLEALGVEIYLQGDQSGETEYLAADWAKSHGFPLIHPYNDQTVIAGQGTIGLELVRQLDNIDQVFVPVGGGGLISGISGYLKEALNQVRMIAVQPANASEMADSIKQGEIVKASHLHTISDGTAGGLDFNAITYQYCTDLVDEFVLVEEHEIIEALGLMEKHLGVRVEPAAALAMAGMVKSKEYLRGQNCVAIVCGGNIDIESYQNLFVEFS